MKTVLQKFLIASIFLLSFYPFSSSAQNLTGIWKGTFRTDDGQNYRLEFQILQNKKKIVTGVSYSWGENISFYGKAVMTGNYAIHDKNFTIQETKTVDVKTSGGTCLMNYRFSYTKSGKEEFLDGVYVGKTENRENPKLSGVWGDCGGGTVHLRRVQTSDFVIEPFLRGKIKTEAPSNKPVAKTPVKPKPKPVVKVPQKNPTKKPVVTTKIRDEKKPVEREPIKTDTVKRQSEPVIVEKKLEEKPKYILPPTTRSRENNLVQTIAVTSPEIYVRLYDNGEIDGDSISVYLDGKLVVSNQGLSTVPIKITIKNEEDNSEHVLLMVAENMGRIPPNTALMIVQDGDKRYSVGITTTEQKNAAIRFRYQKKPG